jgi:heptosyltransferase-2
MKPSPAEQILVVSTNWIGDAIMSMPALQLFRQAHPDAQITLLARPLIRALWAMHPAVDQLETMTAPRPTVRSLRRTHFDRAYIFPNSFRSAFIPFLAGVPRRRGAPGQWRRLLLTDPVQLPSGHQQFEYMKLLDVAGEPPAPQITISPESFQTLDAKLCGLPETGKPLITLLPGAARGPSKRWPAEHFARLAQRLQAELGAQIVLAGGPDDSAVCAPLAAQTGALDLSGKTALAEWAALLKRSDCVVSNDSGGMHLATAVGTPVVAIFGLTDPAKTGPLGRAMVLQKSAVRSRNIPRDSAEAVRALAAVTPDEALAAVLALCSA